MKAMLTLLFLLLTANALASDEVKIEGTLFKKNEKWFLFVENEKASFKKGTLSLNDIPESQSKFLIERAYVQVFGKSGNCKSKEICIVVKSIKPTLLDPLNSRKK
jgi:hypothetical protein